MHEAAPNQSLLTQAWALQDLHGRPAFVKLNQEIQDGLNLIQIEMDNLIKESIVANSKVRLVIAKHTGEKVFLRWYVDTRNRTWEVAQAELRNLPVPIQRHYERINRRVLELNALFGILKASQTKVKYLADRMGWRDRRAHL